MVKNCLHFFPHSAKHGLNLWRDPRFMKNLTTSIIALAILLVCFGTAFQMGKTAGFKTGSEWALVQADVLAREAGLFMPVYLDGDNFRIVFKQPRGLYKKAWEQANSHEEARETARMEKLKNVKEKTAQNSDI